MTKTTTAQFSLHPFGDEQLWASNGTDALLVEWEKIGETAQTHREACIAAAGSDDEQRAFFSAMWFTAFEEGNHTHIAALIGPDGTVYDYDDPRCLWLYEGIDSSGEWPTPFPDDVILLCANCGEPMTCQHPRHITAIGEVDENGETHERKPTAEDIAEQMPKQGTRSHGRCGPVQS